MGMIPPGPIAKWARAWARRRQGPDPVSLRLAPGRIYVLPTRSGMVFGLVLLAMLLGSLNYSNNMGFALTFFLASVAVVSLYLCHRNLVGLLVSLTSAPPVHAGQRLQCTLALTNDAARTRHQISLGPGDGGAPRADLPPGGTANLRLGALTHRRGLSRLPPLDISTRFPLGLFRAWAWINIDRPLLVYPAPAQDDVMAPPHRGGEAEDTGDDGSDFPGDEFSGLRGYQPGESPSRIAWKALARTGTLMSREFRGSNTPLWLDWQAVPGGTEQRISLLTRMALDAEAAGHSYGLRLPVQEVPPASGGEHLHQCLQALATLPA